MPPTSGDAFLDSLGPEQIPALAALYDRFAHAIDPFDPACDTAERAFNNSVADWYDCLQTPKPPFREFRRGIITRCKRHILATQKPPSV
jgi:hypothetical protein